jgi:Gas vesicle synthesis protein GvpO
MARHDDTRRKHENTQATAVDAPADERYEGADDDNYGDAEYDDADYDDTEYDDRQGEDEGYDDADESVRDTKSAGDTTVKHQRQGAASDKHKASLRANELSAAEAAGVATRNVAELTGKPTVGVTALKPSDDGWTVGVEVLEDSRIPSSADVLATYEADVDMDGTLLSYHRVSTYPRGRGDRGGSS